jgi:hypothetical protein
MFKKITSDRDPRDTVFTELGKEFKPYVVKGASAFQRIAASYPKFLFCMMVINIPLSIILVMTVFSPPPVVKKAVAPTVTMPLSSGFDKIMQAGSALRQTIRLKRQVDSLTRRKQLSKADSIELLKDLDSLQHISKPFNSSNHEH